MEPGEIRLKGDKCFKVLHRGTGTGGEEVKALFSDLSTNNDCSTNLKQDLETMTLKRLQYILGSRMQFNCTIIIIVRLVILYLSWAHHLKEKLFLSYFDVCFLSNHFHSLPTVSARRQSWEQFTKEPSG